MTYTCPKHQHNDVGEPYEGCGETFKGEVDEHGYIECPHCGLNYEPDPPCECVGTGALDGVRWPTAADRDDSLPWVERCDMCEAFDSDNEAAKALAEAIGGILCFAVHPRHKSEAEADMKRNPNIKYTDWASPFVIATPECGERLFAEAIKVDEGRNTKENM